MHAVTGELPGLEGVSRAGAAAVKELQAAGRVVTMAGDRVNDAAALAQAGPRLATAPTPRPRLATSP